MDDGGFDALAKVLGRRRLVRAALLGVGLGGAATVAAGRRGATAQAEFCQEKPRGSRCRRGGQCCSGRCKRKKGKQRGKCLCGRLRAPCASDGDCCLPAASTPFAPVCEHIGLSDERVCCSLPLGPCAVAEDCCGIAACIAGTCAGG